MISSPVSPITVQAARMFVSEQHSTIPTEEVILDVTEADEEAGEAQISRGLELKDASTIAVAEPDAEEFSGKQTRGKPKAKKPRNNHFKRWEKPSIDAPFDMAITVMTASWSVQSNHSNLYDANSATCSLFIIIVLFNLYIPVTGCHHPLVLPS